ncbi:MAG: class I SAM-dependent rRNA methyltransferase [Candidatus Pacebacteria bacterium]|nr:class I SAM-dependent rRNA methyltransferase [Candidatus Paceibacterota bacterium]
MNNEILGLLKIAVDKREKLTKTTNTVRLVNGASDDLDGLVLEKHNKHFVAQIFSKKWLGEKETLINFVKNDCGGVYFIIKDRTESASSKKDAFKSEIWISNWIVGSSPTMTEKNLGDSKTVVLENGLKFEVDMNDGLNTGLFLDMRRNREIIKRLSAGKKVLNLFAYTCSFGVYARSGGASNVVNVDISKKILNRGKINYELNGILPEKNEFTVFDSVEYLKIAVKKNNLFDIIIIDPPSFSTHNGKVFSVKKDLPVLIDMSLKILNDGGYLFVATNFSEISADDLKNMVTASTFGGSRIKKMTILGQDEDFREDGSLRKESYLAAILVGV